VLRLAVREQDVDRTAWRVRDARGDKAIVRWRNVRPAHADERGLAKGRREVCQPVRVGIRVIIDIGNDLPSRCPEPGITGRAQPLVLGPDQPHVIGLDDVRRAVARAIVDDDDFVVRIVQPGHAFEAVANRA
jgi:hypothetical protein